jgi:hypothetical protein
MEIQLGCLCAWATDKGYIKSGATTQKDIIAGPRQVDKHPTVGNLDLAQSCGRT